MRARGGKGGAHAGGGERVGRMLRDDDLSARATGTDSRACPGVRVCECVGAPGFLGACALGSGGSCTHSLATRPALPPWASSR